ncbi:MAG: hypothetical protein K6G40_03065 [Eubacterium sp.]|nr:hypothetical protein [Eubacterium sp.]
MSETNEGSVNPLLLEYLDFKYYKDKAKWVRMHRDELDDRLIDDMAMASDLVIEEDPIFDKCEQLLKCLDMKGKFETDRFR